MLQNILNGDQDWETTTWQAATHGFFFLNPSWFFSFLDAECRNVDYEMEEYYHYSFHRGKIHGEATYVFMFQNAILFMEFYLRCWQSPKHSATSPDWTNTVMLEMQKKKKYSIFSDLSWEARVKQFVTDKVPASG